MEPLWDKKCSPEEPFAFICYCHADHDTVARDAARLRAAGFNLWMDSSDLAPAEGSWQLGALNAISHKNCRTVLFYASAASLQSDACRQELLHTRHSLTRGSHNGREVPVIVVEAEPIDGALHLAGGEGVLSPDKPRLPCAGANGAAEEQYYGALAYALAHEGLLDGAQAYRQAVEHLARGELADARTLLRMRVAQPEAGDERPDDRARAAVALLRHVMLLQAQAALARPGAGRDPLEDFLRATELFGETPEQWDAMGRELARAERPAEALAFFLAHADRFDSAKSLFHAARMWAWLGFREAAEAALAQAADMGCVPAKRYRPVLCRCDEAVFRQALEGYKPAGPGARIPAEARSDAIERFLALPGAPIPAPAGAVPAEGGVVYLAGHGDALRLGRPLLRHADGVSYDLGGGMAAKIYAAGARDALHEEKARRMAERQITRSPLCWPTGLLYDADGRFAGIRVPAAHGEPLLRLLFERGRLEERFPAWDRRDLCRLALTVLRAIEDLHGQGILMGCPDLASILVEDRDKVWFTDTDHYQFAGLPAPVYTADLVPPELRGQRLYLCGPENENFSVAALAFMLLMPGKVPLPAAPDGTVPDFTFPRPWQKEPHPQRRWWQMWSYLPGWLRDAFCDAFSAGGAHRAPADRLPAGEWCKLVWRYGNHWLDKEENADARALYPRGFRQRDGQNQRICSCCGEARPENFFDTTYPDQPPICTHCRDYELEDTEHICRSCGRPFRLLNATARFLRAKDRQPRYCPACRHRQIVACAGCGNLFPYQEITGHLCASCRRAQTVRIPQPAAPAAAPAAPVRDGLPPEEVFDSVLTADRRLYLRSDGEGAALPTRDAAAASWVNYGRDATPELADFVRHWPLWDLLNTHD